MNETAREPMSLLSLLHAAGDAQAHAESKLAGIGLSMAKLAALQALSAAGDSVPLSELADRLSCVKSNITQLVDRLESDGLVMRREDPEDRRRRLAVLTSAGRAACTEGSRVQQAAEAELLGSLTGDEARQLAALLEKVGPGTP